MIMSRRLFADASLLVVSFIWGLTFVMVQDAVRAYPVLPFLATRFAIAFLGLLPVLVWRRSYLRPGPHEAPLRKQLAAGAGIGFFLFAGYAFQMGGLVYTTPAKAAFITGLSVVIVPLLGWLLVHERPTWGLGLGVTLALIGLGMLSLSGLGAAGQINLGDVLVLGCAVSFALHLFITGRFAPRMNALILTLAQVATVTLLAGIGSMLFQPPPAWPPAGQPLFAALFTGLLATALAFAVQTTAQRFTTATHTGLIFATEPVFGALGSFLLIGERLGAAQLVGGGLILAGMLAAEFGPMLWRRAPAT